MKNLVKKGFTLAEILIVLLVMGVIASLTIPTLVKNTQQKDMKTKILKTYSDLSQAFQVMTANQSKGTLQDFNTDITGETYPFLLRNELAKYVKYIKLCNAPADCKFGDAPGIVLSNGITINVGYFRQNNTCDDGVMRYLGYIYVDLTGPEDNKHGTLSDYGPEFLFGFNEKGNVFPGIMCAPGQISTAISPDYQQAGSYAVISGYTGYIKPDYY